MDWLRGARTQARRRRAEGAAWAQAQAQAQAVAQRRSARQRHRLQLRPSFLSPPPGKAGPPQRTKRGEKPREAPPQRRERLSPLSEEEAKQPKFVWKGKGNPTSAATPSSSPSRVGRDAFRAGGEAFGASRRRLSLSLSLSLSVLLPTGGGGEGTPKTPRPPPATLRLLSTGAGEGREAATLAPTLPRSLYNRGSRRGLPMGGKKGGGGGDGIRRQRLGRTSS